MSLGAAMHSGRHHPSCLVILIASLTASAAPSRALAQTPPATAPNVALAEQYAAQAFAAYQRRDHAHALRLYQSAFEAAPSADILYNMARVYDLGLGNRQRAIEYYERYTREPDAQPARVVATRQRLFELQAAERSNRADPSFNAIARDFPLDAPLTPAPSPSPSPAHESGGLGALSVAAISVGTAGLVGVGVGIGFGLSARSQSEIWEHECDGNACSSQRGVDAAEAASRRATIATLGFGVGGGLLALATVLWLVDDTGEANEAVTASFDITPRASTSDVGAVVSGHF